MNKIYVPYIRVSSKKQEIYGNSLEGQLQTIKNFIKDDGKVLQYYKEVETATGKRKRPVLHAALEHCKKLQLENKDKEIILITAKLDRLARDVKFMLAVLDSGINIKFCDMPVANDPTTGRLFITIVSAIAEYEAKIISNRVKDGIDNRKRKGLPLGKNTHKKEIKYFPEEVRKKGIDKRRQKAMNNENNQRAYKMIRILREKNTSWEEISNELNNNNFRTSRENKFSGKTARDIFLLFK